MAYGVTVKKLKGFTNFSKNVFFQASNNATDKLSLGGLHSIAGRHKELAVGYKKGTCSIY